MALFDDGECIAAFHEVIGRGHAENLVPAIAALPGRGRAERILVSLGPGSFTGVRIGLAAARALALAWGAEVLGYPTLALVAAMAREVHPGEAVTVCMTGGHGQWFVQDFGANGLAEQPLASLAPADAGEFGKHKLIAGSKAREKAALHASGHEALDIVPNARHTLALPSALLTADLSPIYGRPPDAKLPGAGR